MLRRFIIVALALLLCGRGLASGRYVVCAGGVAALVDEAGAELLPAGTFESIFAVREGALYAAGSAGDWDLYDADGRYVAGPFGMIADMGGALVFRRGGFYGALDEGGGILISPEWTQLTADGAGGYLGLITNPLDEQPDEVYALTAAGSARAADVAVDGGLRPFREGRMPFRAADGRYGCLDGQGNAVIPAEWSWIGDFSRGAAPVSDGAMFGLIDTAGLLRLPLRYTWLYRDDALLLALREDATLEIMTPDGLTLLGRVDDAADAQPAGSRAAVRRADGVTLYDPSGAALCVADPGALFLPGLDGQVIRVDGDLQTLLDADGRDVAGPFQRLLPLVSGRYAALTYDEDLSDVHCALIDSAGEELLPPTFREILPAGNDRLILVSDDTVTLADLDGKSVRVWTRR